MTKNLTHLFVRAHAVKHSHNYAQIVASTVRGSFVVQFDAAIGGHDAAFDALNVFIAAKRNASVSRTNDHDVEAWTLHVLGVEP